MIECKVGLPSPREYPYLGRVGESVVFFISPDTGVQLSGNLAAGERYSFNWTEGNFSVMTSPVTLQNK